jgi:hypothetical protein
MKPLFTMRHALGDSALLADAMKGESWAGWRVLLIASVGEELTENERAIFKTFTGRDHEPGQMIDTWLTVSGRRSGKTTSVAALVVYLACLCDWSDDLSLGERGVALYLAPTQDQAGRAFRYAREFVEHSPLMANLVANRTADSIELSNGIDIEIQAANWRYVRGVSCIAVVLDECAFLRNEADSANKDEDIVTALRPSLVTTNGPMLLISSPATEAGVVYNIHKRHFGPAGDPLILVVQADSKTLNPKLDQARIDREYALDAEGSLAEWGGKFRVPISVYLPRSLVEAAVEKGVSVRPRLPGVQYFAFIDCASGTGTDSFAMAIGHRSRDDDHDVILIDAVYEARPPFAAADVVKGYAEALKFWGLSEVMGDDYGGGIVPSMFAKHGVRYSSCPLTASQLYLHCMPAWTSSMVRMCDVSRAVDQLVNLRRKVGQAGQESVVHLGNSHDDLANVVSGLIYRLTPLEPVAWDFAGGDGTLWGVVTAARDYIGESSEASDTMKAWLRTQDYGRAPDGGLGRGNPHRAGSVVW